MSYTATAFLYFLICGICVYFTSRIPEQVFVGFPNYEKKRNNIYYYFLPIVVFTLFWGLRYDVGTDYLHYKDLYESVDIMNESHGQVGYEWGYLMTNRLFQSLGLSYLSIFIYSSFIFVFSVYFFCSQENRIYAMFAVFFFMAGPVLFAQNGTRQMLAISFYLCGLVFLGKRQLIPWVLMASFAVLNHRSLIVPVLITSVFYFVRKPLYVNKYFLVALNLFLFIFGHEFQRLFIYRIEDIVILLSYEDYITGALDKVDTELVYNTGIGRFLLFLVNSIIFLSQDLFLTGKKDARYYMYWCFIIGASLTPLFWGNETLGRLAISFTTLSWGSKALALTALYKKKDPISLIIVWGVVLWCILSFFIAVESNSNGCGSYQMVKLF